MANHKSKFDLPKVKPFLNIKNSSKNIFTILFQTILYIYFLLFVNDNNKL